jgi:hypothetical protein
MGNAELEDVYEALAEAWPPHVVNPGGLNLLRQKKSLAHDVLRT